MPIARAALAPEYRVFYDTLQEDGDWTLIEPWGYVFRPRVNFVAWSPYENGFWVPSDVYGWVWISTETFGWATYHYGRWLYDDYQGWVWIPGIDWGPAWVSWEVTTSYVGWAPLVPSGAKSAPLEAMQWAPISELGSTDLSSHLAKPEQLGSALAEARPVHNPAERGGVVIERGPSIEWVEKQTGPLTRVKLAEIGAPPGGKDARRAGGGAPPDSTQRIEAVKRAAVDAAREAGQIVSAGGPAPARVSIVRAAPPAPTAGPATAPEKLERTKRGARSAAPADTTKR
jgi:hypothetical protein